MSIQKTIKASCLCGQSHYEASVPGSSLPMPASLCHCNRCRHIVGTLAVTAAALPKEAHAAVDALAKTLSAYQSSGYATRYSCKTCGSQILLGIPSAGLWIASTGVLEHADDFIDIQKHIYIEDTVDGGLSDWLVHMHDSKISRLATGSKEARVAPEGWRASKAPRSRTTSDRLHAYCHCRGVNMYIARPSEQSAKTTGPWPDALIGPISGPPVWPPPESESWWLRANKQKFLAGVCTCDSCRLASGVEVVQWAFIPAVDISLSLDGKEPFSPTFGTLKSYRSSDDVSRYFCGVRGAIVFWIGDIRPGLIDVAVGLLDAPEGSRAESWLEWRCERVSYREDSVKRAKAFTTALEDGIGHWGKTVQGRPE